jgi:hypothetical protein
MVKITDEKCGQLQSPIDFEYGRASHTGRDISPPLAGRRHLRGGCQRGEFVDTGTYAGESHATLTPRS